MLKTTSRTAKGESHDWSSEQLRAETTVDGSQAPKLITILMAVIVAVLFDRPLFLINHFYLILSFKIQVVSYSLEILIVNQFTLLGSREVP